MKGNGNASGFAAVSHVDARLLILGTLPGAVSLERGEYYAQKRNAFWPIMEKLIGVSATAPYSDRTRALIENGIALWDVCAGAERNGSLDSEIADLTAVPNDFAPFFASHRGIQLIAFNGQRAAALFQRMGHPTLSSSVQRIRREVLPSTSSAHARISFDQKLDRWRGVLASSVACNPLDRL